MKTKVTYHSSTGNTKKLARAIAEVFDVEAEPMGESSAISSPVDLLFIGDGIHFGKPTKRTVDYIEHLDKTTVKNVAVFGTYGGQAIIGEEIRQLLTEKGIGVVDEPFTCKGHSWLFMNIGHPNRDDLQASRNYATRVAASIN